MNCIFCAIIRHIRIECVMKEMQINRKSGSIRYTCIERRSPIQNELEIFAIRQTFIFLAVGTQRKLLLYSILKAAIIQLMQCLHHLNWPNHTSELSTVCKSISRNVNMTFDLTLVDILQILIHDCCHLRLSFVCVGKMLKFRHDGIESHQQKSIS